MHLLLKTSSSQNAKEALHEIDPGGVSWSVMKADLRVFLQPRHGGGIGVGVEVVHDHAETLARIFGDPLVQEAQEG